jgi:peptide/nickel transport system permease protein
MRRFFAKKLLSILPVVIGIILLTFFMIYMLPGDPAEIIAGQAATPETIAKIRVELGLDQPMYVQLFNYVSGIFKGNFGNSIYAGVPVTQLVLPRFWNTIELSVASMIIAVVVGVIGGIVAGVKRNSVFDTASMSIAVLGVSVPSFFTGLVLMYIFSLQLRWFPTMGYNGLVSLVLPSVTLAAWSWATIARMTRTSMLEVLNLEYVRTARAMGLKERTVIYKYALRNALVPIVTAIGLQFGYAMAGAVITETVFSWPGIGTLIVEAIFNRDFAILRASILIVALTFVLVNLATDIVCYFINPRLRHA